MSDVDIYEASENLISSDEYSEDDDLMNAAISTQNAPKLDVAEANSSVGNYKMNKFNTLLKIKTFHSNYKKRSIAWLNNKQKREKYKNYLYKEILNKRSASSTLVNPTVDEEVNVIHTMDYSTQQIVDFNDTNTENLSLKVIHSESCEKEALKQTKSENKECNLILPNTENSEIPPTVNSNTVSNTPSEKKIYPSSSTCETHENNETRNYESEKSKNLPLYREINEMFSKYDAIVGNQMESINSTKDAVAENVTRILLEIQTLNDILQTKETEWNRLLHLKKVKEEILTRLVRKKHVLEMKTDSNELKYSLSELKELELYLSEANTSYASQVSPSSTQKLVETRANMRKEDLKKERFNTNRLQSILVSSNILQKIEASNKYFITDNSLTKNSCLMADNFQDDIRQKKSHIGKRLHTNEFEIDLRNISKSVYETEDAGHNISNERKLNSVNANYSPTLEKLLNSSSVEHDSLYPQQSALFPRRLKLNFEGQSNNYRIQKSGVEPYHEVSVTPISSDNHYLLKDNEFKSELLRSALNTKFEQNASRHCGTEYGKSKYLKMNNVAVPDNEVPICQECNSHESRFVCGGCENQWYCSRRCQITAWDKHSEICNE